MSNQNTPELLLGNHTRYPTEYNPSILTPIPRESKWKEMGLNKNESLPFSGIDIWTAYELSWLNTKGKPVVAVGEIFVPATSTFLVESKSLKLYLNSINQSRFKSTQQVKNLIEADLSKVAGLAVTLKIVLVQDSQNYLAVSKAPGECIDSIDIEVKDYQLDPKLLSSDINNSVQEVIHSNLLKSNCPVTNQPDWATIIIEYKGPKINRENLLKYFISYRQHNDFHEQCVERIFLDIQKYCKSEKLTVYARYLRRGGLDINPFRSNISQVPQNTRLVRQ